MKIFILTIITAAFIPHGAIAQNLSDFYWLTGEWIATNNKPGKIRTERWETAKNKRMNGFGTITQEGDTTILEKMHIETKNGRLYFVAEVPENKEPVYFRITTISVAGFESENPAHDFPKKIIYKSEANNLSVTISGNGKSTTFHFMKR